MTVAEPVVKTPLTANWPETYCKNGKRQAPIWITDKKTTPVSYNDLQFDDKFYASYPAKIVNDDYTVGILLDDMSVKPQISQGGLKDNYTFLQFQFRWPSEHVVNFRRYPLELAMIFYNSKYGSVGDAIPHEDGFIILVSFYGLSLHKHNPIFNNLIRSIPQIENKTQHPVSLERKITLSHYLPRHTKRFYRYHGSVTKPYCDEIVIGNGTNKIVEFILTTESYNPDTAEKFTRKPKSLHKLEKFYFATSSATRQMVAQY
ncbi:carbonic anhydrase 2-like [Zophobas morio]|uniref:carbonic anhydrase 2-like n=1 Tax=Zophobas morio TaxID=2755281 RepID=UPI0030827FAD